MATQQLLPSQIAAYNKDGYIIIRNFLKEEEIKNYTKLL